MRTIWYALALLANAQKTYSYTWEAYHAYIEFLKSQPESKRNKGVWLQLTKTLYERAAAHHPTNPALWISYHAFLVSYFGVC